MVWNVVYPYCGHSVMMGKKKRSWQDVDYVLGYFGRSVDRAKKAYLGYVEAGLEQGRRDELTGGGLIRSLDGWAEVKKLRLKGQAHMMSDERILWESEFVDSVLSQANERYERRYELKRQGYDLGRIGKRVAEIYGMEAHEFFSKGRQQRKVNSPRFEKRDILLLFRKGEKSSLLLGRGRDRYVAQRVGGAIGNERPRSRVRCGKGGSHCAQKWL